MERSSTGSINSSNDTWLKLTKPDEGMQAIALRYFTSEIPQTSSLSQEFKECNHDHTDVKMAADALYECLEPR